MHGCEEVWPACGFLGIHFRTHLGSKRRTRTRFVQPTRIWTLPVVCVCVPCVDAVSKDIPLKAQLMAAIQDKDDDTVRFCCRFCLGADEGDALCCRALLEHISGLQRVCAGLNLSLSFLSYCRVCTYVCVRAIFSSPTDNQPHQLARGGEPHTSPSMLPPGQRHMAVGVESAGGERKPAAKVGQRSGQVRWCVFT